MNSKKDPQLDEISRKMDVFIQLLAHNFVKSIDEQKDKIAILSD